MSWLSHRELRLVMGVAAAPGDPNSVESPLVVVNLLDNTSGISLAGQDGWSPKIPGIEGSGIWSDSPLSPGRQLISATEGNVTETMKLVITGSSVQAMLKTLNSLYAMANNARAFWTDNAQIQPVYLHWWASLGNPTTWQGGRQYALIYNMTIDPVWGDSPTPSITASITIERESYWRGIPPGANPKQWRYEFYGQPYDYSKAGINGTDSLYHNASPLNNRSEFTSTQYSTLLRDNCIVVPANSVPGDAPALMFLTINFLAGSTRFNIIMGKKTVNIPTLAATAPAQAPLNDMFVAADCTLNIDATAVADTGASVRASTGANTRVEISFATATNQNRWTNTPKAGVSAIGINTINRFIGRWMVFLRCRQNAGALGDITMYLRYGTNIALDTDGVKLNVVNPPVIAGAGNTTNWGLVYMGIINVPINTAKADINTTTSLTAAAGLSQTPNTDMMLTLFALRSAGVGLLYLNDLVLIPVDEGSMTLEMADASFSSNLVLYDDTGFNTHGNTETYINNGNGSQPQLVKFTGTGIQLTPNVENRIYPISYDSSQQSVIADTLNYSINIVPRWRGIRDIADIRG